LLDKFEEMFKIVRQKLLTEGRASLGDVRANPKGEVSKQFDLLAEEAAVDFVHMNIPGAVVYGEEKGFSRDASAADWVLVIDPVDGSTNFKRGIEACGFSVAAFPAKRPIQPKNAEFALVGNVFTGSVWKASRGKGAFCNGKKCAPSGVSRLSDAMVMIDLDFKDKARLSRILPIARQAGHVRRLGACTMELTPVASGGADAYVDVRGNLTPENFLGSYLIIHEAGGVITDGHGSDFPEMPDLTVPHTVVAAGTKELHREILGLLDWSV
jgi:fructose-1,6-bisphosphatase/inositol monophosphatase family enzyme